ncbi:succinylglutamate desuccinylase/aspartoacylase family protein [uncultured Methanobrevibacter sp.]|uniref:succinylglutamate desuccinylase/aspartoacylase domain-containing protein n=1 Tax=uncultured Methanobrevibacter sp. TaxID=253161 RepID=UPI002632119F|nr:succinylglutamate desuccinylase/aspartoacylase family protein [uncultured Methanobrevibacter sp.]
MLFSLNVVFAEDNVTISENEIISNDNVEITTCDLVKYYQNDSQFEFNIKENGLPVGGVDVNLNINGNNYTRVTDNHGNGKLNINLMPGNYSIITSYKNTTVKNNIVILSFLQSDNLVKYYHNDSQFIFKVIDKSTGFNVLNVSVTLNINGVFYHRNTNDSGFGKLNIGLRPGKYIITLIYDNLEVSNNITVLSFLQSDNLVKYYHNDSQFLVKLLDKSGNTLVNKTVKMNINGVFYYRVSNGSGIAKLNIGLNPGKYIITVYYDDLDMGYTINVLNRLSGNDISSIYGNSVKFSVKLVDSRGNPADNNLINFNIAGKIVTAYTNDDGIATINLNNSAGNYIITYYVDDIFNSNSYSVKNYYSLTTLNWNTGADITKNSLIKNNLPKSDLINQIINAAKSGTPMLTFKGGEGKTVFITAGIHGSELSSQVAALNLINYLENTPIKGTVYIIPVIQPKATANNVRNYNDINLNSKANVPGSISNNAVELIFSLKCDSYGDFHCTMPGGDPGKNVAMGSNHPLSESARIANYISKKTGYDVLIYDVAGKEYSGAMEDTVNIRGIPAVTCEVVTPHGTIDSGSVDKSFNMMKSLLQYNKLI